MLVAKRLLVLPFSLEEVELFRERCKIASVIFEYNLWLNVSTNTINLVLDFQDSNLKIL